MKFIPNFGFFCLVFISISQSSAETGCEHLRDFFPAIPFNIGHPFEDCTCTSLLDLCTREYFPVCGTDGVIYSTHCTLCGHIGATKNLDLRYKGMATVVGGVATCNM